MRRARGDRPGEENQTVDRKPCLNERRDTSGNQAGLGREWSGIRASPKRFARGFGKRVQRVLHRSERLIALHQVQGERCGKMKP